MKKASVIAVCIILSTFLVLHISRISKNNQIGNIIGTKNESSSWPYEKMITYQKNYYVVTSEKITSTGHLLGQIEHFSNDERDSNSDNFSNFYSVGTKLYTIRNFNVKDAIAVEITKGIFMKARNIEQKNNGR
ncbi:hypothetical protein KYB31_06380 [Clostridium felsineum]|uniref:hypothetical protein n=1 Tax=Clostridium felsineum TaxID=36839 RepID=UPI00214D7A09|nr:hypothetical protein [Clostridium felsineum]MCR3758622.1 hypothetical protein [Clostridium felsineum]